MEYNTAQEKLILPDYGRNIQSMVEFAMTLTDRKERQRCAEAIIKIMSTKVPLQKDPEDQQRMLWDHLALISGYRLDVDSPFPINIHTEEEQEKPHLGYPQTHPKFRHYGQTLEEAVRAIANIPEGESKQAVTELALAQMAKSLYQWNRNVLSPEKLVNDMATLTDGKTTPTVSSQRMNAIIAAATSHQHNVPTRTNRKRKQ